MFLAAWLRRPPFSHAPAMVVLASLCTGVVIDAWAQPRLTISWLAAVAACGIAAFLGGARPELAFSVFARFGIHRTIWLLVAVTAFGALWHQQRCRVFPANHVGRLVSKQESRLVHIRGTALSTPICREENTTAWTVRAAPQSRLLLRAEQLQVGDTWRSISGKVWVRINGCVERLNAGDQVTLTGILRPLAQPQNPGQVDRRPSQYAVGVHGWIQVPHVANVQVEPDKPRSISVCLARIRTSADTILRRWLSPATHPLASAMLLGIREELPPDGMEDFLCTGTSHLLAISGVHTGILAGWLLLAARGRLLPFRFTLVFILLLVMLFVRLTDARPPVVRAGVLVQLVCLAWLFRRRASFLNSLGCAGIVVVLLNPISLFSPGTHLSFLAVLALGVAAPSWHRRPVTDPLDRLIWRTRPAWWHAVRALFHRTLRLVGASAMVWLVTLPLIAYHFHLVSPIAIPLNVVLAVPLATSLLSGMVLVMTGGWLEPVAIPMAVICEGSLQLLRHIINRAALLPGGYFWCAGPGSIAVSCFYILLSMGWMFAATPRARVTVGGIALTVFGLLWLSQDTIFRESRSSLRATFLSVGHGVCVVLQFPNGETWLYDAGRLGNPRIAVDWVSQFLWKQRVTHLDRIVISHVDIDHYSLVPGLLKRFSVAEMGMTGYCQPESMNAQYALSRLFADHGVPKRILRAGWERQVGSCTIQVLQPWQRWPDASDNAHSLVLCVSFAGRHLLLPGDLEGRGLDSLLQRHMPPIDAAMLPHHGSLRSEPVRFAEWAQSGILVVSGGDVQAAADLNAQFRGLGIRLFSTARDGAVTLELCPTGEVRVKSFRDRDARQ